MKVFDWRQKSFQRWQTKGRCGVHYACARQLMEALDSAHSKQERGMQVQLSIFLGETCPGSICNLMGETHLTLMSLYPSIFCQTPGEG